MDREEQIRSATVMHLNIIAGHLGTLTWWAACVLAFLVVCAVHWW